MKRLVNHGDAETLRKYFKNLRDFVSQWFKTGDA